MIHRFVLGRLANSLKAIEPNVAVRGISDLAVIGGNSNPRTGIDVEDRKFSGNSLRCKRSHVLYHGTLLYDSDLELVERLLGTPPRQPDYRQRRKHGAFVTNLKSNRAELTEAVRQAFPAEPSDEWPSRTHEKSWWTRSTRWKRGIGYNLVA